ncbi:transmembrane protease serine 9-like [Diachasmimorpha longicaudata]|uniref:transmembrane protease serine 9-like n=1 Tax=Diachasmimorpha longicaudata TaxID=58733 RepID=UPI0030B8D131
MATEALGNFAKGHIYGWGFPKANTSAISRYLQGLLLIVLDRETCWEYYNTEKISEDELCVVDPRGGSLCDGDSGGPLIVDGKLAGVISSGPTDCSNNIPGYVMSISYYKQWIEDVLKGTAKAITYFAETPADTTYTKPNSQPARKSEQSNQRDELSSHFSEAKIPGYRPRKHLQLPKLICEVLKSRLGTLSKTMQLPLIILTLAAIFNHGVNGRAPSKIVGGKRVDITEASFMAMIRHNLSDTNICGGTIIDSRHILTAAHCFTRHSTDPSHSDHPAWHYIVVGEGTYHPDVQRYYIEEVYSHPNYLPRSLGEARERADIAVIKLKDEIPLTPNTEPISLSERTPRYASRGLIYGWGRSHWDNANETRPLQGLIVKVDYLKSCMERWPTAYFSDDELCVHSNANAADCKGDSGGPLVMYAKVVGVIGHGSLFCNGEIPSGVANVAYHKKWIENAIKGTARAFKYFSPDVPEIAHHAVLPSVHSIPPRQKPKVAVHDELSGRPLEITRKMYLLNNIPNGSFTSWGRVSESPPGQRRPT